MRSRPLHFKDQAPQPPPFSGPDNEDAQEILRVTRVEVFCWTDRMGREYRWNITDLMRELASPVLIADRMLTRINLSLNDMRNALAANTTRCDPIKVDRVQLVGPVLILKWESDEGHCVIDGWHRIEKAVKANLKSYPAIVIPERVVNLFKLES